MTSGIQYTYQLDSMRCDSRFIRAVDLGVSSSVHRKDSVHTHMTLQLIQSEFGLGVILRTSILWLI
jgi:hypothetical protein